MRTIVLLLTVLFVGLAFTAPASATPPQCDPDYPCDPYPYDPLYDCRSTPPMNKFVITWVLACATP